MNKKVGITSIIFLLATPALSAAEWSVDTVIGPSFGYDDNVLLQDDEQGSFDFSMRPTLVFGRAEENFSSYLSIGYSVERYASLARLDSENPFMALTTDYQMERTQFSLSADYTKDTTRSEALDNTGDFSTNSTLRRRGISPSISYQLTEVDTISTNFNYSETDYSTSDFSSTKTRALTLGWQRQFTERFSSGLNATASNYKSGALLFSNDDDSYNFALTLDYQLSELWSLEGNLGYRILNTERKGNFGTMSRDRSTGSSFSLLTIHEDELNTMSLELSKELSPSSEGNVNEQERIAVSWSRELSERWRSGVTASYQETISATNNNSNNRKNLDFSPSLRWQFASNMGIDFKYHYRRQQTASITNGDVDSNSISVTLDYDWDGIKASR